MLDHNLSAVYHAKALLFDMDGTLVDSTPVVERTWHRFAKRHGLDGNVILAESHGRRTAETIALFTPMHIDRDRETARFISEEIADVDGITAIAGAQELLFALPSNRWGVVTSATRELAMRRMTAAGLPIPDILIAAEDVQKGKPAPDGYLSAAQALGVSPEECIVFEDAVPGLIAAKTAGMKVFAIGHALEKNNFKYEHWMLDFTDLQLSIPISEDHYILLGY